MLGIAGANKEPIPTAPPRSHALMAPVKGDLRGPYFTPLHLQEHFECPRPLISPFTAAHRGIEADHRATAANILDAFQKLKRHLPLPSTGANGSVEADRS